jgi:hypothetical protein
MKTFLVSNSDSAIENLLSKPSWEQRQIYLEVRDLLYKNKKAIYEYDLGEYIVCSRNPVGTEIDITTIFQKQCKN